MELYLSDFGILFLVFVYTPMALIVLFFLWRRLPARAVIRMPVTVVLVALLGLAPIWDVVLTTVDMRRLCRTQAGTHRFESVVADGYAANNFVGRTVLERGYAYVEQIMPGGKVRRFEQVGGNIVEREVTTPKSRYQVAFLARKTLANNIVRLRTTVVDSGTDRLLGEAVSFSAFPGWLDRLLLRYFGLVTWHCHASEQGDSIALVDSTLIPRDARKRK